MPFRSVPVENLPVLRPPGGRDLWSLSSWNTNNIDSMSACRLFWLASKSVLIVQKLTAAFLPLLHWGAAALKVPRNRFPACKSWFPSDGRNWRLSPRKPSTQIRYVNLVSLSEKYSAEGNHHCSLFQRASNLLWSFAWNNHAEWRSKV